MLFIHRRRKKKMPSPEGKTTNCTVTDLYIYLHGQNWAGPDKFWLKCYYFLSSEDAVKKLIMPWAGYLPVYILIYNIHCLNIFFLLSPKFLPARHFKKNGGRQHFWASPDGSRFSSNRQCWRNWALKVKVSREGGGAGHLIWVDRPN
jgi:hypothetical protein